MKEDNISIITVKVDTDKLDEKIAEYKNTYELPPICILMNTWTACKLLINASKARGILPGSRMLYDGIPVVYCDKYSDGEIEVA